MTTPFLSAPKASSLGAWCNGREPVAGIRSQLSRLRTCRFLHSEQRASTHAHMCKTASSSSAGAHEPHQRFVKNTLRKSHASPELFEPLQQPAPAVPSTQEGSPAGDTVSKGHQKAKSLLLAQTRGTAQKLNSKLLFCMGLEVHFLTGPAG